MNKKFNAHVFRQRVTLHAPWPFSTQNICSRVDVGLESIFY